MSFTSSIRNPNSRMLVAILSVLADQFVQCLLELCLRSSDVVALTAASGKPLCQRVRAEVLSAVRQVANLARLAVAVTIEFRAIPVGAYGAIPRRPDWGLQIGTSCDGPGRQ